MNDTFFFLLPPSDICFVWTKVKVLKSFKLSSLCCLCVQFLPLIDRITGNERKWLEEGSGLRWAAKG